MAKQTKVAVRTNINSPGTLVLQWLTYAFWGWTVLALVWLTAISVNFFIAGPSEYGSDADAVAYSLAAVLVLFAISLICDAVYSRREPVEKHGASMVIMIIHAVIFALCGIGALIAAVFALVNMLIGNNFVSSTPLTILVTGLIIAVVYGATLLRTVRPFKLKRSAPLYWVFMGVVTLGITSLAIAGPTWNARETRTDRLIERGLTDVSSSVSTYTQRELKLPATLNDVRNVLSEDGQALLDQNLVEYKPGTQKQQPTTILPSQVTPEPVYSYQLCVTYKAKKGSASSGYQEKYQVNPSTYAHPAGHVCYELQTSYTAY